LVAEYQASPGTPTRPAIDPMNTSLPVPARRCASAACARWAAARRLTSSSESISVSGIVANGPDQPIPALETTTSSPPSALAAASTVRLAHGRSRRSPGMYTPPVCLATLRSASTSRPATATWAPRSASVRAVAAPMPLDPPVISTRRLARLL
jgi:hypothetical protein